jgi:hypothetical protein
MKRPHIYTIMHDTEFSLHESLTESVRSSLSRRLPTEASSAGIKNQETLPLNGLLQEAAKPILAYDYLYIDLQMGELN